MVFQARKWGWKRIAARLLLVPVLAGGSAAIANAQQMRTAGGLATGVPAGQTRPAAKMAPGKSGTAAKPAGTGAKPTGTAAKPADTAAKPADPKAMLKEGRKALAEGRFNDARDLAQKAEASNTRGKWGLFDDTPNALRKDIEAAQLEANQNEAERLVKQAKATLDQKAETPAARAAALDSALQMARRAEQLHGPYTIWDFTHRADKLAREIEEERSKLKNVPASKAMAGRPVGKSSFAATLPPAGNGNNSRVQPAGSATRPGTSNGVTTAGGFFPGGKAPSSLNGAKPSQAQATGTKPATPSPAATASRTKPPTTTPPRSTPPIPADPVASSTGMDEPMPLPRSTPPTPADAIPVSPVASAPLPHSTPPTPAELTPTTPVASDPLPRSTPPTPASALPMSPVASDPLPRSTPPTPTEPAPASPVASAPMDLPRFTPPTPPEPSPTSPVASAPKPTQSDTRKAEAIRLMTVAKHLVDRGDLVGAHAKYMEAAKLGAEFAATEYSPGFALQELGARGAATIDRLVKESRSQMAKNDFAKAEAALNAASEIADALSLFPRPIEEAKNALRLASSGKHGGMPPGGLSSAAGVETLVPLGPASISPTAPVMAPGSARVDAGAKPATGGAITGRELLDQAALQFRKGDFETARRLALQAHNMGAQAEAGGLLNQIDAEVLAAKQRTAMKSFEAAAEAIKDRNHGHALGVLVLIDPRLLPDSLRSKREELIAACKAEVDKTGGKPDSGIVATGGNESPIASPNPMGGMPPMTGNAPGTARVGTGSDPAASPDKLTNQVDAMKRVAFQKLRSEGLKIQADAQAAFGRGDTDVAIQMLLDFSNRVRASNLEPASVALLLRPVESRLEMFRVMKGQTDALAREKKEKTEARELIAGRGAAEEQRKAEVQKLVREYHALVQKSDFARAERVAMQAKQLEPDDPAIGSLAYMARINRRVKEQEQLKSDKEKFFYEQMTNAETLGPVVDTRDPIAVQLESSKRARLRGSLDDSYLRTRSPAEFEIEMKLDNKISLEFQETPLKTAVDNIHQLTGLPISWDTDSLQKEAISATKPISEQISNNSVRNALYLILSKAGLSFVIEYDTVRITTEKKAKGRLYTKVFSVADLVTPVPNFALPDYANFEKMLNKNALNSGAVAVQGLNMPTPFVPPNGLTGGAPAGSQLSTTSPAGMAGGVTFGPRGSLENNPLAASAHLAADTNTRHEQLIRLITTMVRPFSWDSNGSGGPGKIEYYDLGSALVVNQTADVIQEIRDLLEALRRLQDLAVAIEVRIISLSETWFERMGVDFAVNVKTHNTSFEPQLTGNVFRPEPFLNDINAQGAVIGLTPAGAGGSGGAGVAPNFTPDLDVPFRATSFQYAIPGFGGYPNNPGFNGGVSLGLAFLNDIQVYMFMEAAQGDRRINVMQAPKLTLFNGQAATINISEQQFFVTSVSVLSVNGQLVFIPNNSPLPAFGTGTLNITMQAVVSADRRFVRINLPVTMGSETGATVPLFPITTFITPVFEGGSQGVPIPFTQFLQQPSFTILTVQTTVVCPDGGTVLLGGLKMLSEGRNEFGPPFLSKIPYLNRLFKNVGIGRETRHIMIMVTPRIIINAEEEINQTEGGGAFGVRPGQ